MRQITNEEVLDAVSLEDAELILRYCYLGMRSGETENHQRLRSHAGGARLSTLGGILPGIGYLGSKTYATSNGRTGFAIVLFSSENGLPVACLQGEGVTRLKGSVTTALTADVLAKPDAGKLAIFGTGTQARAHIAALRRVRDIKSICVVSRNSADEFIRWAEREHGIAVTQASGDAAAAQSDIIVLATRSSKPLFDGNLVRPGTFITAIGTSTLDAREVDEACVRRADLIGVEWKPQAKAEAGDLVTGVDWDAVLELGDILSNPGLEASAGKEIRLFKSVGLGIADVAVAIAAYARLSGGWDRMRERIERAPFMKTMGDGGAR